MKITVDLLRYLGAEQKKIRTWSLKIHGYEFSFSMQGDFWYFNTPNNIHCVTDIEECLSMAFMDGVQVGRAEKQDEIREVLGI